MSKKTEKTIATLKADVAKRMHIASIGGRYHVLEIPAADGAPYKVWQGPFASEAGVELFLDELLTAYAAGTPEDVFHWGSPRAFEQAADVQQFLERQNGVDDPRALALELCRVRPWDDVDLPF